MLLCRVELLCRRKSDPARAGRGPFSPLFAPEPLASDVSMVSRVRFSGRLLSLVEFASKLNSFVDPAMLLARSSKLGEGKNSKELVVLSSECVFPPNEKREWLLWDVA